LHSHCKENHSTRCLLSHPSAEDKRQNGIEDKRDEIQGDNKRNQKKTKGELRIGQISEIKDNQQSQGLTAKTPHQE
jgi:hypothetical protein